MTHWETTSTCIATPHLQGVYGHKHSQKYQAICQPGSTNHGSPRSLDCRWSQWILGDLMTRPINCTIYAHAGDKGQHVCPVSVRTSLALGNSFAISSCTIFPTSRFESPKIEVAPVHEHHSSANRADRKPPMGIPFPPWRSIRRPKDSVLGTVEPVQPWRAVA